MTVNYTDKFGLPADRFKLAAGSADFDIIKIEIVKSKKRYEQKEDTEQGTKVKRDLIDIAYIDVLLFEDGKPSKEVTKYYAPNAPIVAACKDILKEYGKPDGTLREAVHINEVKTGKGDSKNEYLFFT